MSQSEMADYINIREFKILQQCNFSLNFATGYDNLCFLLKMSNETYNFNILTKVASNLALDFIFLDFPNADFSLETVKQSRIFNYCFSVVCQKFGWVNFPQDLKEFADKEGLPFISDDKLPGSPSTEYMSSRIS